MSLRSILTVAISGTLTASCNSSTPSGASPYSVSEILRQCSAFLGRRVHVAGYLGTCQGYDCHLFTDKAGADAWYAWIDGIVRDRDRTRREPLVAISIGGENQAFDAKAEPLQHGYVVISGRMDDYSCDGSGGTDRSAGIHPTDIRVWTPSETTPAKTK